MFILFRLQNESNLPICQWVSEFVRYYLDGFFFFHWALKRWENAKFVSILCFASRDQHLCKFTGTKKSVYIRKEFNSHRTGLGLQHGRRFIVLGHKYGRRDVMWKHNIFTKGAKNRLFVEPSCSTCPVASVVPPPCASLTSSAAIPSTFCSSPFVWLYSGCPPSVTVWEKSYKQSISICINKLKLLSSNHLQLLQFNRDL